MTIEVQITNKHHDRNVEVQTVDFDKESGTQRRGSKRAIEPGRSETFYVHLLRNLDVSEAEPRPQPSKCSP